MMFSKIFLRVLSLEAKTMEAGTKIVDLIFDKAVVYTVLAQALCGENAIT